MSPPVPACEHGSGFYIEKWFERFFEIVGGCPLPGGGWWYAGGDRFVVCDIDEDCPELVGPGVAFECRAGFCQSVDVEEFPPEVLTESEIVRLCTGHVPRGEDNSLSPELAAAIGLACPHENPYVRDCVDVPEQCPDPR